MTPTAHTELLGKNIRRRRRIVGLTLEDVAQHLNVRMQTVQKYETGTIQISIYKLQLLAELFQCPITTLIPTFPPKPAKPENDSLSTTKS